MIFSTGHEKNVYRGQKRFVLHYIAKSKNHVFMSLDTSDVDFKQDNHRTRNYTVMSSCPLLMLESVSVLHTVNFFQNDV